MTTFPRYSNMYDAYGNKRTNKTAKMLIIENKVGKPIDQFILELVAEHYGNLMEVARVLSNDYVEVTNSALYHWVNRLNITSEVNKIRKAYNHEAIRGKAIKRNRKLYNIEGLDSLDAERITHAVNSECTRHGEKFTILPKPVKLVEIAKRSINSTLLDEFDRKDDKEWNQTRYVLYVEDQEATPHFFELSFDKLIEVLREW